MILGLASTATRPAAATQLMAEGFETPAQSVGLNAGVLPSGWSLFTNNGSYGIVNAGAALSAPAAGSQYLALAGTNTGVSFVTTGTIQADTTYVLSAAIGNLDASYGGSWSIQAWAGSVGNLFLGQTYSGQPTSVAPTLGTWVTDSYSFDSANTPSAVGDSLVVFLNNYLSGTSYYDTVTVTAASDLPEPSALSSFAIAVLALGFAVMTRRGRSASV